VSRVRSRSQGHGSTPFTRALYPPGGEHLGDEPDKKPRALCSHEIDLVDLHSL
jgi:hypothetical protein